MIPPTDPNPASKSPPRFKFLLAVVVCLSVVLVSTLVTFMLPEQFASTVRIKVMPDRSEVPGQPDGMAITSVSDPRFLPTQIGIIYSEAVLSGVAEALDLPQDWGKKYYDGQRLKISECTALLRGRLDVRVFTNTSLIDIRSYSDSAPEAARVANEVAKVYHLYRVDNLQRQMRETINGLEKQLALQERKVEKLKVELARMAESGEAAPPNSLPKLNYLDKQKVVETELDLRQLLVRRISAENLNFQLPRRELVTIVDSAVPGFKPVRPNVPLNIILSIMLGAVFGVVLAGLVYLFQLRAFQRKVGVYGATHSPGLRNSLRMIIGLMVGVIGGYNCAMPMDASGLVSFPLVLAAGGIGLGFVELANLTPLPPTTPTADGSQESMPPRKY